jgi:hypothetical protein
MTMGFGCDEGEIFDKKVAEGEAEQTATRRAYRYPVGLEK